MNPEYFVVIILVILSLAPIWGNINFVSASTADKYYEVGSSPYGKSYQEWMEDWWKWYVSVDKQHSPNFEGLVDGHEKVECSYNQNISSPVFHLWFINPDRGQIVEETCKVPAGKALAVPIDLGLMDYNDPKVDVKNEENLARIVKESNIYPNEFDITLDGVPLQFTNEESNKVTTDLFNITLPENNIWYEGPVENLTSVADGWILLIKPLPPGEHILKYTGGYRDHRSDPSIPVGQGNKDPYIQEVTYRLMVNSSA
jgi:hypothetical protein